MAFGKISAVAPKKASPPPKPVPKPVMVYEKGTSIMEISLVAPTSEEASDFLCSAYFDFIQQVSGTELAVYTREFETINRFSETKQELEETILKPVGREFVRRTPEDGFPMDQCTITLSQTGNTGLSLDLHFTWTPVGRLSANAGDVVFALLNYAEGTDCAGYIASVRSAAAGRPVFWIITNFEQEILFWGIDSDSRVEASMRRKLMESFGLKLAAGEFAAFSQTYGGLEFAGRDGGYAVMRTTRRCREYMPVGCHAALFVSVGALRRYKAAQDENASPDATVEKIVLLMKMHENSVKRWYEAYHEKGGSGK